jgi:hypothetical protein
MFLQGGGERDANWALSHIFFRAQSGQLFDDEHKINAVDPKSPHADVGDDGDDLAFQVVQELLEFALIGGHFDIETMHPVLHVSHPFVEPSPGLHCWAAAGNTRVMQTV